MKQIRLIAVDIDGTLTNREKLITPRTQHALLEAQKQGAGVRPPGLRAEKIRAPTSFAGIRREADCL